MISREKLRDKIKLQDKVRDFRWIKKQYDKKRLYINGSPVNEVAFNQFRQAVKLTQDIYENSWDLEIEVTYGVTKRRRNVPIVNINIKGLVICFPEVKITNSRRKEHIIKDLLIKITFDVSSGGIILNGLYGGRLKVSYAEYCSNYAHSHLNTRRFDPNDYPPYWGGFCTGSGHININIAEINSEGFTESNFTSYLLNLMSLASWESLEGTPHISIANVVPRSNNTRIANSSVTSANNLYQLVLNKYKTENLVPDIEIYLENSQFQIRDDEKFEKFLNSAILTDSQKSAYLCMKDESGVYYQYGRVPSQVYIPTFPHTYIFQGIPRTFEVYGSPQDRGTSIEYFVHPEIKKHIKNELEYDINKNSIRESTIKRYSDQIDNVPKNIEPDKVSV